MIIDSLKNAECYYGINKRVAQALEFLKKHDFSEVYPGKYELDGEKIYYMVQEYKTRPSEEGKWEAHRRYIDIQFIAEGSEMMGYGPIDNFSIEKEYEEEKDILFLKGEGNVFHIKSGSFVIFNPQDVHLPCISTKEAAHVKKIVVKVMV